MMEKLTLLVTVVLALSVASERLVEIIKGLFKTLDQKNPDPRLEGYRRSALQAMAVVSAMLTAFLASDYIPQELGNAIGSKTWTVIGLGLLASGGSGFWNAILTYVGKVKDAKTTEADIKKVTADVTKRNPGRAPLPIAAN